MHTATVFGSLSNDTRSDFGSLFDILLKNNISDVLVGGYQGQLKEFSLRCREHNIQTTLVVTEKGKELGYGTSEVSQELVTKTYFDKKNILSASSELFIFLPTETIGLGLLAEIFDLLDYSVVYCNIIKQDPPRIVFMGKAYKTLVENLLDQNKYLFGSNIEYVN